MKPYVSIIIPVYNLEAYIQRCIESVFKQSFTNYEIICVDDCSTDSSVQIIESIRQCNKNIELICNEVNQGPGISRYKGIKAAKGEYILFLDGDDTLSNHALEVLTSYSLQNKTDIIKGQIDIVTLNGQFKPFIRDTLPYGDGKEGIYQALLEGKLKHNLAATLFSRSLVCDYDYDFIPGMRNGEDGYFFFQMVSNIQTGITLIQDVVYYYHMNPLSSSHVALTDDALRGLVIFYNYVSKINYQIPDLTILSFKYCTINLHEFALRGKIYTIKKYIKQIGAYPFLSFKYRLSYLNIRQFARWYIKLLKNKINCIYE